MPDSKPAGGLSRRSFVQASSAALILTATAVIHPIEAWGLEAKGLTPATSHEGSSADKGGYIHRGFNDLTWL